MSPPKERKRGNGKEKLIHNGFIYKTCKECKDTTYYRCKERNCYGKAIKTTKNNKVTIRETGFHACEAQVSAEERARDAAIERLRELTLSVEGSVKAIELVRKVIKEVDPEVRPLLPNEDSLIQRVKRWARSSNIQLVRANPEDYLIPEGEEPLVGFGDGPPPSENVPGPSTSAATNVQDTPSGDNRSISFTHERVKTGVVYTEPVAGLVDCEDKKPSGLIYLRGKVDGHYRAVIEGQSYTWKKTLEGLDGEEKFLYACQDAPSGCPVTVIIDNAQKKYELRGSHAHESRKKDKRIKGYRFTSLKRVDEGGNEIGVASLDEFLSGTTDWEEESQSFGQQKLSQEEVTTAADVPSTTGSFVACEDMGGDDNFDDHDHGGDDFQMDFEAEAVPQPKQPSLSVHYSTVPQVKPSFHFAATSSNPPLKKPTPKISLKNIAKSGDRCFVCGDELIVSEALAASTETFRKACRYLNVKSEREWFPRGHDASFFSFCESCTTEIVRIQELYKKVEEIQSLIFNKIESVEKRIADAEIVDNWMAEVPQTTALRFEGFRKQVMINYRNKLKLRREVRFGRKTGHPLIEIQPGSTAHMFAKDPTETDAFRRIVPESVVDNHVIVTVKDSKITPPTPLPRRTRGRPKSKKPPEQREDAVVTDNTTAAAESLLPAESTDSPPAYDDGGDDVGFQHDFDDSQDAISVTSEKEIKFWESDPSKLNVRKSRSSKKTPKKYYDDDDYEDHSGPGEGVDDSDPDYDEQEDEDEEWACKKKKPKPVKKLPSIPKRPDGAPRVPGCIIVEPVKRKKPIPKIRPPPVSKVPRKIIFENKKRPKKIEPVTPKPKGVRSSQSHNIKFPDAVLTKDGRVFMEGIEIIKNPPGTFQPRPYSVTFSCGACGKVVLGFWKMRQHICGHHLGMYKCHVCFKEFTDPKIIDRHMIMAHGDPVFEDCPICSKPVKIYKSEKSMLYHRWSHLNEEEKKDPQYENWRPPKERIRNPNAPADQLARSVQTFMCGQCGKTFRIPSALKRHELTHAPDQDVSLMCQYCGKTFNQRKGLSQHVYRCARKGQDLINLTKYSCPKCPTQFSTRATRSKHIRRFHSNVTNVELPFTCPKCPRSFGTRSGFRNHKRVCIDGEKGYNNRSADPQPSTSSTATGGYSELKADLGDTNSSSSAGNNQGQGSSSNYDPVGSAAALGFNYHFMGANNYDSGQYHQ